MPGNATLDRAAVDGADLRWEQLAQAVVGELDAVTIQADDPRPLLQLRQPRLLIFPT